MSLVGTWDLESSENFDEYMKELGVGLILRKTAGTIKPTVIISNDGDKWTLKMQSTLKSSEVTATLGVEFDEKTLDGRESKSVLTLENPSRLVHVQKDPKSGKVVTSIVREIVGDRLVQTLSVNNVQAVRKFTRTA